MNYALLCWLCLCAFICFYGAVIVVVIIVIIVAAVVANSQLLDLQVIIQFLSRLGHHDAAGKLHYCH